MEHFYELKNLFYWASWPRHLLLALPEAATLPQGQGPVEGVFCYQGEV